MVDTRFISVFDMIGPIMVGPSSSHTAGAVRLGLIGRTILGRQPEIARVELHGSFAETGRGHGTDKALIAGLLGMDTADPHIRDSFDQAARVGMSYTIEDTDLGDGVHPNSVRLTLQAGSETVELIGASIGGGMVEITELQGYPVSISCELDTLIVISEDQPGTINGITGWLLGQNINVAYLKVGREQRGGQAIMIIETDEPVPDPLVRTIQGFSWVRWVRKIDRLKE